MNRKEISEIRRRFKPENSNIGHVYGCYVNSSSKEVIANLDEPLSLMPEEEKKQFLDFLKKALSGTQGKNLTDIIFTSQQVSNSDEHRLLMALRDGSPEARETFFRTVIEHYDSEDNYLILCANDAYDVPHRRGDGGRSAEDDVSEHDDQVFRSFVCAICPVKDGKLALGYFSGENEFHNCLCKQLVCAPETGFLFPAFDHRSSNIYNALFYSRKAEEMHYELIEALFRTEMAMSPAEERQAFEDTLVDAEITDLEIIRGLAECVKVWMEENRDGEPLSLGSGDLVDILSDCGAEDAKVNLFREKYEERFGKASVNPENIVDLKKFQVKAGEVTITVNPEMSFLLEAGEVDGKKYIMIPADGVELNGFAVKV